MKILSDLLWPRLFANSYIDLRESLSTVFDDILANDVSGASAQHGFDGKPSSRAG